MKVIVIGAGEVGYHIARKLSSEDKDVVLIDKDEAKVAYAMENLDVQVIHGSGSSPSLLRRAGIESADMIIAVTNSDEVNMIACLIAGSQDRISTKIARIRDKEYLYHTSIIKEQHLNIDLAINPDGEVIDSLLKLLEVPGATDLAEFAGGKVKLINLPVPQGSKLIGQRLMDLRDMLPDFSVLVAAIYRGKQVIIPRGLNVLAEGDNILVVETGKINDMFYQAMGLRVQPIKRVMIYGASNIGTQVALALEGKGFTPKIIDKDQKRCEALGETLYKSIVLHGDPIDEEILIEENIADVDAFLALSEDEEANILVSLLAKSLGAKKVFTLIHRVSYMQLVSNLGMDVVVSANLAAVGKIMRHIRRGKVLSVTTFRDDEAEAIEVEALETSDIVNKPIKDLKFPKDAIIGAIMRNDEVFIPDGESQILPGDRVVIFALRSAIPKVEKTLTVKLEFF